MNTQKTNFYINKTKVYRLGLPILAILFLYPSIVKQYQTVVFTKQLHINTSKQEPPRIAFKLVSADLKKEGFSETGKILLNENLNQGLQVSNENRPKNENIFAKKIVLRKMVVDKTSAVEVSKLNIQNDFNTQQAYEANILKAQLAAQEPVLDPEALRAGLNQRQQFMLQQASLNPQFVTAVQEFNREDTPKKPKDFLRVRTNEPAPQAQTESTRQVAIDPLLFTGDIELAQDVTLGPNQSIRIVHYIENAIVGSGEVNLKKGYYRIKANQSLGSIKAELLDQSKMVIADSSFRIKEENGNNKKLIINRLPTYASVRYTGIGDELNAPSTRQKAKNIIAKPYMTELDENILEKPDLNYSREGINPNSWHVVRNETEKNYPSIDLIKAGEANKIITYPTSMIEALRNIQRDMKVVSDLEENGSVIFGQVTFDQHPLAEIEVKADGFEDVETVYFNEMMLPDPRLKKTSSNGYYAILDLPAGFHSVRAWRGEEYYSHMNVQTDSGSVSNANLSGTITKNLVQIKSFDAFSGEPVNAIIKLQSYSDSIEIEGQEDLYFPELNQLSFLVAKEKNERFLSAEYQFNSKDDFIYIPLVKKIWMENIISQNKINIIPDTGTVVGFVTNSDFNVYVPYESEVGNMITIYFDSEGNQAEKPIEGGGFIIFNLPMGTQSITVISSSDQVYSQIIRSESNSVSVLKYHF